MALVKLEINGRRIIAVAGQTVLTVARQNGITDIPTLCHDEQLEPFTSCFVCVVEVEGMRGLQPSCSTKISEGMHITTDSAKVHSARKTALDLLVSNHYADCIGPCKQICPAGVDVPNYVSLVPAGKHAEALEVHRERNPFALTCGRVCPAFCEDKCRRGDIDESIAIRMVKRLMADHEVGKLSDLGVDLAQGTANPTDAYVIPSLLGTRVTTRSVKQVRKDRGFAQSAAKRRTGKERRQRGIDTGLIDRILGQLED